MTPPLLLMVAKRILTTLILNESGLYDERWTDLNWYDDSKNRNPDTPQHHHIA